MASSISGTVTEAWDSPLAASPENDFRLLLAKAAAIALTAPTDYAAFAATESSSGCVCAAP
eukprot:CAMPEP_0175075466 /NCGR_PEP_ID=MMETSP0052_2-20121109/22020_1 /TAXON_ID=51329 ORGANISM="Polytomella parva, Strain SAG 63-3" /NCGR_SAMPLE_ID=MMETSP0052_2 /ASSEMBLY_ACC=CAM_ASM_000194 /LENGTH=60 /DNA_ID=CAMNT_0016344163 /DNA_START=73 /DNA_END=256 /DNA_ORIENTATION=-